MKTSYTTWVLVTRQALKSFISLSCSLSHLGMSARPSPGAMWPIRCHIQTLLCRTELPLGSICKLMVAAIRSCKRPFSPSPPLEAGGGRLKTLEDTSEGSCALPERSSQQGGPSWQQFVPMSSERDSKVCRDREIESQICCRSSFSQRAAGRTPRETHAGHSRLSRVNNGDCSSKLSWGEVSRGCLIHLSSKMRARSSSLSATRREPLAWMHAWSGDGSASQ